MLTKISTRISLIILTLSLVSVSANGIESAYENKIRAFAFLKHYTTSFFRFSARHKNLQPGEIGNYNRAQDYESVTKIFRDNKNIIVSESNGLIQKLCTLVFGSFIDSLIENMLFLDQQSANVYGKNTVIKIIKINNQVAGFMTLVPYDKNSVMIEILAVDEKYRRRGVGLQLLTEAQTMAQKKKFENLILYVKKENKPAINLYKKFGFKDNGEYNKDLAIMKKPI